MGAVGSAHNHCLTLFFVSVFAVCNVHGQATDELLKSLAVESAHPILGPNQIFPSKPALAYYISQLEISTLLAKYLDAKPEQLKSLVEFVKSYDKVDVGSSILDSNEIGTILNEQQINDMCRLKLAVEGFSGLGIPSIGSRAGLSSATVSKIAEVVKSYRYTAAGLFQTQVFSALSTTNLFTYSIEATKLSVRLNLKIVDQLSLQEREQFAVWMNNPARDVPSGRVILTIALLGCGAELFRQANLRVKRVLQRNAYGAST